MPIAMKYGCSTATKVRCGSCVTMAYALTAGPPTPAIAFIVPLTKPATTPPATFCFSTNARRASSSDEPSARITRMPMMICSWALGRIEAIQAPKSRPGSAESVSDPTSRQSMSVRVPKNTSTEIRVQATTARMTPSRGPSSSTTNGPMMSADPMPVMRCDRVPTMMASNAATSMTTCFRASALPRCCVQPHDPRTAAGSPKLYRLSA